MTTKGYFDKQPITKGDLNNYAGSLIIQWNPVENPNYIQTGVKKGGFVVLLDVLQVAIDNVPAGTLAGTVIYFNNETALWSIASQSDEQQRNKGVFLNPNTLNALLPPQEQVVGAYAFILQTNLGAPKNTYWAVTITEGDNEWYDTNSGVSPSSLQQTDIINNLTSNDSTKVLSAPQGKILQDSKVDKVAGQGLSTNDFNNTYKGQLDNFTENAQDAIASALTDTSTIDFAYDDSFNTITANVKNNSISDDKLTTGINATKIADGSVSDTEFQYLNSVSSNIQEQFDTKAPTQLNAVQRFVSPSGNDSHNGQIDRKMLTIEAALASLDGQSSGDVDCEAGTYAETLTFGTARQRRTLRGASAERTIISRTITYNQNCQQCTLTRVKLEVSAGAGGGVGIQVSSTLSGFVFDSIFVGGNHANSIIIDVSAGGSGFITITNSDLNNKIINLANTVTPRYLFINNCSNALINAGTGWIVIKGMNCAGVYEISSNNNILEGWISNAVIPNVATYNAIVAGGVAYNGYYLCNYTQSGVFATGDVILRNHPLTIVDHKHYNANAVYYNIGDAKTYFKKLGTWQEIASISDRENITASNGLSKIGSDISGINATTTAKGVTQLSNSFVGTSQTLATTEKALSEGLATKQNAEVKVSFSYNDASPANVIIAQATQLIEKVKILILIPFDGIGASLEFGDAGQSDRLLSQNQVNPSIAATYESNPNHTYGVATQTRLTINSGSGASQGSGVLLVNYKS